MNQIVIFIWQVTKGPKYNMTKKKKCIFVLLLFFFFRWLRTIHVSHFGRMSCREGEGKYLSGYRSTNNLKRQKRLEMKEERCSNREAGGRGESDVKVKKKVATLSKTEKSGNTI